MEVLAPPRRSFTFKHPRRSFRFTDAQFEMPPNRFNGLPISKVRTALKVLKVGSKGFDKIHVCGPFSRDELENAISRSLRK